MVRLFRMRELLRPEIKMEYNKETKREQAPLPESKSKLSMKSYFIILVTDIVILLAQHVLVLLNRIRMCIMILFFVYILLQRSNSNNPNH